MRRLATEAIRSFFGAYEADALDPLSCSRAGALTAVHPAAAVRHRWRAARIPVPGPRAAAGGGLGQAKRRAPVGQAVHHAGTPRQFECTRLITAEHVKSVIRRVPGFGIPKARAASKPNAANPGSSRK